MTDKTPSQLIQEAQDRAIDQLAAQHAAHVNAMGPAQREGARVTLQIFERIEKSYGRSVALSAVLQLGILEVCRQPALLAQFQRMAAEGEVGIIKP